MQVRRPIAAVGVYVPGGTAVLPSSALMLTVPAALAGCATIVLATPPRPDGSISPEVVYCARKAGATHVLRAGGAQAVAALAWGTASTPKVDKIFGPGNQCVVSEDVLRTGRTLETTLLLTPLRPSACCGLHDRCIAQFWRQRGRKFPGLMPLMLHNAARSRRSRGGMNSKGSITHPRHTHSTTHHSMICMHQTRRD